MNKCKFCNSPIRSSQEFCSKECGKVWRVKEGYYYRKGVLTRRREDESR